MSELFDICVNILNWIADITGLTYKEANIWIFVIIHPIITISLLCIVIKQKLILEKNKHYNLKFT